jgi:hypothetical protein
MSHVEILENLKNLASIFLEEVGLKAQKAI